MNSQPEPQGLVILVTGGSGFVGSALIRELLSEPPVLSVSEIRIFDLHPPKMAVDDQHVRYIPGDIRNPEALTEACRGVNAVFHLAAMIDWGTHPASVVYDINVGGTKNALESSRLAGVSVFVYTSSLDAVITGKPLNNVDEDLPYPDVPANAYCGSKAEAEKLVAAANGNGGLRTVSLRPSGIWGEGDPYHLGAMIRMLQKGAYGRIGDGSAVQQLVYVGNLAHAHLLAAKALLESPRESSVSCSGSVYFITDGSPENFFKFFDSILEGSGYDPKPRNLWIPRWFMMILGVIAESFAWMVRPIVTINPRISRFAVRYTCNNFTFSSSRAEKDFAFSVKYTRSNAFKATCRWFQLNPPPVIPEIPDK